MGEVADMMLDGTLCATCGGVFDDVEDEDWQPLGYPRWCDDCVKALDGLFEKDGPGAWRRTDPATLAATARIKTKARRGKRGKRWRR